MLAIEAFFLYLIFNNLRQAKKVKVRTFFRQSEKILLLVFSLFYLYIVYKYENNIYGYILGFTIIIGFASMVILKGIGEGGVYTTRGRGIFLMEIDWDKIEKLSLKASKKNGEQIVLDIKGKFGRHQIVFKKEDQQAIENIIKLKEASPN